MPKARFSFGCFGGCLPTAAILGLGVCLSASYGQTTSPEGSQGTEEQELTRARRANEEAQAEYYRLQAEKLREPPPRKSMWESLSENPASVLGGLAAFVALISFIFNYRATLQSQRDTQFYEALKRLGDKDSPTVRCSAAGLLSQMGKLPTVPVKTERSERPIQRLNRLSALSPAPHKRQYFKTAFYQLLAGLSLEQNLVCLTAIADALKDLIPSAPKMAISELYDANLRLQIDFCVLLARLWAAWGKTPPAVMSDRDWDRAAHLAGYDKFVLQDFITRHTDTFSNSFERYRAAYASFLVDGKRGVLAEIEQSLEIASRRLALNVDLSCLALSRPLQQKENELRFYGFFLVGGDLIGSDLRFVSFGSSQLTGLPFYGATLIKTSFVDAEMKGTGLFKADLTDASLVRAHLEHAGLKEAILTGAKLHSAYVDDSPKFDGANWWQANFFHYLPAERNNVDSSLLERLYSRFSEALPEDPTQFHPSVRIFLEARRQTDAVDNTTEEI